MVFRVIGDLEKITVEEGSIVPVMGEDHLRNIVVPGFTGTSKKDISLWVARSSVPDWYKVHCRYGFSAVSAYSYNGLKGRSDSMFVHESQFILPGDVLPREDGEHLIKAVDLPDLYGDSQFVIDYYLGNRNRKMDRTAAVNARLALFTEYFPLEMIPEIAKLRVPMEVSFAGNLCLTMPPPPSSTPPTPSRP